MNKWISSIFSKCQSKYINEQLNFRRTPLHSIISFKSEKQVNNSWTEVRFDRLTCLKPELLTKAAVQQKDWACFALNCILKTIVENYFVRKNTCPVCTIYGDDTLLKSTTHNNIATSTCNKNSDRFVKKVEFYKHSSQNYTSVDTPVVILSLASLYYYAFYC